jgi:hypothetical protein
MAASTVWRVEAGELPGVTVATAGRLLGELGILVEFRSPYVARSHLQRDAAHARCSAYVRRRLEASGWRVAHEVEVGSARSRGFIDILASHRDSGVAMVIEIKTELVDLGEVQRTLGWYERESWAETRRLGWKQRGVVGVVARLATEVNEGAIQENRVLLQQWCPTRARQLNEWMSRPLSPRPPRSLALIDPASRRRRWLMPARVDGRRSPAPYEDYADFMRRLARRRPR